MASSSLGFMATSAFAVSSGFPDPGAALVLSGSPDVYDSFGAEAGGVVSIGGAGNIGGAGRTG